MKAFHSSSLALKYPNTYLYCCFPKCWFFVQWRTSRRNETCADQTRRDVRIIMRTFHSVHGISTYLAQRVTRWDFMKTSCIFSFDSSMSSIVFYLNCTAKLPMWLTKEQQLMVQLNNWQIFPCLREAEKMFWNPTIFNIIRLVVGSLGQLNHRPSIWCS